jgi:recombination protein RecT
MNTQLVPVVECEKIITAKENAFNEVVTTHNEVEFKKECFFALDVLRKNDYLAKAALRNPGSLQSAIMNVATVGLSLNPALKHAYLLPRGKEVCLDVSYMGMIQLATDTGSIKWVQAEVVYEKDGYTDNGIGERPVHTKNPFDPSRGKIVGAYCTAKTIDNDYLTTVMSIDDIYSIRNRSEAYKRQSGPWKTDEAEMIKKTVIKRAAKTWPKTKKMARLNEAIEVVNHHEGINFEDNRDVTPPSETAMAMLVDALTQIPEKDGKSSTERLLGHCQAKYQRVIENLEDLNFDEVNYCINFLKDHAGS